MGKLIQYNEQRGIMLYREEQEKCEKYLGVYDGTIVIENQYRVSVIPLIDRDEINWMLKQDNQSLCSIENERYILRHKETNDEWIMQTIEHHDDDGYERDMIPEDIIEILQVSGAISNYVRVVSVIRRLVEEYIKLKHPDYDE